MKKFIFAAFIAAVALVSCSNEANRSCYKVTYTVPAQEAIVDSTGEVIRAARPETEFIVYKWASSAEIDACTKNWKDMGYKNVLTESISKTESGVEIKTMADCLSIE